MSLKARFSFAETRFARFQAAFYYRPSAKGLQNVYSRVDTHNGCGADKVKIAEKALLPNGKWRSKNRCLSDAQYNKLLERETAKR